MKHPLWRTGVFAAALLPPACWLYQAAGAALGPDPGKALLDRLGQGGLVLLLLTLGLTPLQRATRWNGWAAVRRQLGLWSFAYAGAHLACYLLFILGLEFARFGAELRQRPYVLVGTLAWSLLLALALTSNRASMRRLGRRWKSLHRLAYAALALVLLHMLWVVRADLGRWLLYAAWALLLGVVRLPALSRRPGGRGRAAD